MGQKDWSWKWQPTPVSYLGNPMDRGAWWWCRQSQTRLSDSTTTTTIQVTGACLLSCFRLQACPTLGNPMGYSLPGSSVHGILQARILEGAAMSSSRGSSQPRDQVSSKSPALADRIFTTSVTWEFSLRETILRLWMFKWVFPPSNKHLKSK